MSDNGVRHERERSAAGRDRLAASAQKYAERRALNNGSGDALSKAFEIALTPTIMAGVGFLIDRWLGTRPVFMLALAIFTFVYVLWKMMRGYDVAMRKQEAELLERTRGASS